MTPAQFARAIAGTRIDPQGQTAAACRLVLVDGLSRTEAARRIGIDGAAVSRAIAKLAPRKACPHCAGTGYVPAE